MQRKLFVEKRGQQAGGRGMKGFYSTMESLCSQQISCICVILSSSLAANAALRLRSPDASRAGGRSEIACTAPARMI